MKKLPVTIFPLIVGVVILITFMVIVPENGDLISSVGDMILGQIIGIALAICLVIDIKNFLKRRRSH